MAVTGPILAQLTLARQSFANNSYNEVHGNQPNHLSADTVARIDGKTHGWTPLQARSLFWYWYFLTNTYNGQKGAEAGKD